jgi:signal transduction histidine kinase
MTLIPEPQSLVISSLFMAAFAGLALATLWQVRDTAVYLWAASGLAGALYSAVSAGALAGPMEAQPVLALLAGMLVLSSASAKVVVIRLLSGLDSGWRPLGALMLGTFIVSAVMLSRGVSVAMYVTLVSLGVGVLAGVFVRYAYRLGRDHAMSNAKWFAVVLGLQAIALIATSVLVMLSGESALPNPRAQVPLATPVVFGVLAAINNALFIALVLDVYVRRLDAARADAMRIESERARLAERERLLADMHDGLGSQLASAKIRFERGTLSTGQAGELLQECVNDLHLLVDTLRGSGDDLRAALSDLRYRLDRRLEGVGTRLLWSVQLDEAPAIPSAVVLNLLRGVQEAITNALKHAHAREIRVEAVYGSDTGVDLSVQDDGRGIGDTSALSGRGISSMRRRAFEAGATFAIEPGPGGGTRVSFRLPTRVA